jgi:hypothetical protein
VFGAPIVEIRFVHLRILLLLRQRSQVDETYFDYRRAERPGQTPISLDSSASGCLPTSVN